MTVDFNTTLILNGAPEENVEMFRIFSQYSDNRVKGAYLSCATVDADDKTYHLSISNPEDLCEIVRTATAPVKLEALGPFGCYSGLDDVDIFRDIAEAVPQSAFTGQISGGTSYTEELLECELEDGLLHICYFCLNNDELPDAYVEMFCKKLPYEEFVELFHVNTEEFGADDYSDFILDSFYCEADTITDLEYEDFIDTVPCTIDSGDFESVIEQLSSRNLTSYEDFSFENEAEFGDKTEYDYDPVAKKAVGETAPLFLGSGPFELNGVIAERLAELGLPNDNEAIGNLSVDDVYAIISGTYTAETAQETAPTVTEEIAEIVQETVPAAAEEVAATVQEAVPTVAKKRRGWIGWLIAVVLIALLVGAYCFFSPFAQLVDSAAKYIADFFAGLF